MTPNEPGEPSTGASKSHTAEGIEALRQNWKAEVETARVYRNLAAPVLGGDEVRRRGADDARRVGDRLVGSLDIERVLTLGVPGPRAVVIIVIGDA